MESRYIDEAKAPAAPKKVGKNIQQFVDILENMPEGQVAEVHPGPDQSVRGMKTSFGRIASARGWEVQTWDIPGATPPTLYVKRIK